MEPLTIGALSVFGVITLILAGFHIAIALALVGFLALFAITGRVEVAASLLSKTAQAGVADYVFAVIPLFVLMGVLVSHSGATRDLFTAAAALTRRLRGGLGVATVGANAVFAAVTGVSVASAAVFSKIAVPEMARVGYQRRFALGIVGSSALLGMLIPPSILMIVYGVLAEQSIGRLFAAGILPGILVAVLLALMIVLRAARNPALVGREGEATAPAEDAAAAALRTWPLLLLIVLVLGGIYTGWFTATEAGAVGAAGALILALAKRSLGLGSLRSILLETGQTAAAILLLLVAAQIYSRALTLSGLPAAISSGVLAMGIEPILVVAAFILVILVLGCFIDSVSILLLTMPIMVPVVGALGFDLIWFGIVAIIAVEIGLLTPPFGIVVFAMKASLPGDVRVEEIFAGVTPFLLALGAALAIIVAFPPIVTLLPDLFF
ncbi:MAG: TRAP transporter large permease [Rhodovarius sp.]|nr:TRAP transporter large permease [Rhodovarius sp.]MDW8313874.1 TRAP transporter large permease [Rhodovarius sp.]